MRAAKTSRGPATGQTRTPPCEGVRVGPEPAAGDELELDWLAGVTAYAITIPLRGRISLFDGAVLIGFYVGYLWRSSHAMRTEPELVGVALWLAGLGRRRRRASIAALFVLSAVVIATAVGPFATGLIHAARAMGVSEFLAVQWLAPLASEAPELVVAGTLAARGHHGAATTALLSSKLNQWTLLVGGLPISCWAGGGGWWLPLDALQAAEFLLTAGQTMLGVALLVDLQLTTLTAALLAGSFAACRPARGYRARRPCWHRGAPA